MATRYEIIHKLGLLSVTINTLRRYIAENRPYEDEFVKKCVAELCVNLENVLREIGEIPNESEN